MSVSKVFKVLIIIVACVLVGALVLNILLPNVTTSMVDAAEQMVYQATGLTFDWNGNGTKGTNSGGTEFGGSVSGDGTIKGDTVEGFTGSGGTGGGTGP